MIRRRTCLPLALLVLTLSPVLGGPRSVNADERAEMPVREQAPVLDGNVTGEGAWDQARALSIPSVAVPAWPPAGEPLRVQPTLLALHAEGALHLGVRVPDAPGPFVGLTVFLAPSKDSRMDEVLEVSVRPRSLRQKDVIVRGPQGVGRAIYPVRWAADVDAGTDWSLEVSIDLAPFLGERTDAPFRMGLLLHTRTPGRVASSPKGAVLQTPDRWHVVSPPKAGWTTRPVDPGPGRAADARETQRMALWNRFTAMNHAINAETQRDRSAEALLGRIEGELIWRLDGMKTLRPDLAAAADYLAADTYRQLGVLDKAKERADAAIAAAPGWREPRFLRHVVLGGMDDYPRDPDQPSDYAKAREALLPRLASEDLHVRDGARAARASLDLKEGAFVEAQSAFRDLVARYPRVRLFHKGLEFAQDALKAKAKETLRARRDAPRPRPRVRFVTSRGIVLIELDPEGAPSAVNQLVWLARQGFYDGTRLHRAIPFFGVQGGDPFSKPAAEGGDASKVGLGHPGYAVLAEATTRSFLRGRLGMIRTGEQSIGSQFFLTTGTALHLDGELVLVGEVVEGRDVLDTLVQGDVLKTIEVVSVDPKWTYEPVDAAGDVPKAPVPTVLSR